MCLCMKYVVWLFHIKVSFWILSRDYLSIGQDIQTALYHPGDLLVGVIADINGIMTRHPNDDMMSRDKPFTFDKKPTGRKGILLYPMKYQIVLTLLFAINEINENPVLLPNISLGLIVYESFLSEAQTLESYLRILTGTGFLAPNYRCTSQELVAVITCASSRLSILLANMFGMLGYPQISYGSTDPELSDKVKFPYFYRTVPSEKHLGAALSLLLKYFGWTWIGIIYSDEERNESIVKTAAAVFVKDGVCIEFMEKFTIRTMYMIGEVGQMLEIIKRYSATVIVFWTDVEFATNLLRFAHHDLTSLKKMWLIITDVEYLVMRKTKKAHLIGSWAIEISKRDIPGLMPFLWNTNLGNYEKHHFANMFKSVMYRCDDITNINTCKHDEQKQRQMLGKNISLSAYRIYNALYVLAQALQDLMVSRYQKGKSSRKETMKSKLRGFHPSELHSFLKKVNFINNAGEHIYFDSNGEVAPTYDLLNYINKNDFTNIRIGNTSFAEGEELYVNNSTIVWPENFHQVTPRSVCSESCPVGYRKSALPGKPHCCYTCIECPTGEISNQDNTDNCRKCPEDKWPNERKDRCVSKPLIFLSYQEFLGALIASTSVFLCLTTLLILAVFMHHQNTSIVKANNKSLSFLLLLSISLTLLWCLAFVGQPGKMICFLRQAVFGICFTVSISALLAKTVIVLIAFHATKPGSKLKRYIGQSIPRSIVVICSALQIFLCVTWLVTSPPAPFNDFQSEPDQIIIGCKEGIVLYIILVYIGCLAMKSLVIAFLARNLPDVYNEAKLITFSMIVFFSVWISFIPAYMSAKGKYTVAVEVFAIMASSAGILVCIFFPKCYIIFCEPGQARNLNINRRPSRKI